MCNKELQMLRQHDISNTIGKNRNNTSSSSIPSDGLPFPRACVTLLRSIPGNSRCIDCRTCYPDWASVSYGILICTTCAAKHRSYGVRTSRVRSISMDNWTCNQVLAMLEGGNDQLQTFYARHLMSDNNSSIFHQRYQTKAAQFYRTNMDLHVRTIGKLEQWKGRVASRSNSQTIKRASIKLEFKSMCTKPNNKLICIATAA